MNEFTDLCVLFKFSQNYSNFSGLEIRTEPQDRWLGNEFFTSFSCQSNLEIALGQAPVSSVQHFNLKTSLTPGSCHQQQLMLSKCGTPSVMKMERKSVLF